MFFRAIFLWYNEGMEDLKATVARNLTACRKAAGLTQLQLAEKLNYSDKAVSKWERGESLPDLSVLYELARLYGVTLDYFTVDHADKKPALYGREKRRGRVLIAAMSCLLVWFVATLVFAMLYLFEAQGGGKWLLFVWALPVSCILCVIFAGIWAGKALRLASVSALLWSLALALFLSLTLPNAWLIFVVAVPLQIIAVCWFLLRAQKKKIK